MCVSVVNGFNMRSEKKKITNGTDEIWIIASFFLNFVFKQSAQNIIEDSPLVYTEM